MLKCVLTVLKTVLHQNGSYLALTTKMLEEVKIENQSLDWQGTHVAKFWRFWYVLQKEA